MTIWFALMIWWLEAGTRLVIAFSVRRLRCITSFWVVLYDISGKCFCRPSWIFLLQLRLPKVVCFQWIWAVTNLLILASEGTASLDTLARLRDLCSLCFFIKLKNWWSLDILPSSLCGFHFLEREIQYNRFQNSHNRWSVKRLFNLTPFLQLSEDICYGAWYATKIIKV